MCHIMRVPTSCSSLKNVAFMYLLEKVKVEAIPQPLDFLKNITKRYIYQTAAAGRNPLNMTYFIIQGTSSSMNEFPGMNFPIPQTYYSQPVFFVLTCPISIGLQQLEAICQEKCLRSTLGLP